MIELLEEGRRPDGKLLGRCQECGALVRCDSTDADHHEAWFTAHSYVPESFTLPCPTTGCPKTVEVQPDNVTTRLALGLPAGGAE